MRLPDLAATKDLGQRLALEWLALPDIKPIMLLVGNLGAGKTSLVQGIARGLKIDEPITSPTFALSQHYQGLEGNLVHLDLYRLEKPSAADELFSQEEEEASPVGALMAVEWPERLGLDLAEAWHLELRHQDEGRLAQLTSPRKAST